MEQITGYRKLSAVEVELINEIKAQANNLMEAIAAIGEMDVDKRWLAIAQTDLQKGFMALIRSIAKPDGF